MRTEFARIRGELLVLPFEKAQGNRNWLIEFWTK